MRWAISKITLPSSWASPNCANLFLGHDTPDLVEENHIILSSHVAAGSTRSASWAVGVMKRLRHCEFQTFFQCRSIFMPVWQSVVDSNPMIHRLELGKVPLITESKKGVWYWGKEGTFQLRYPFFCPGAEIAHPADRCDKTDLVNLGGWHPEYVPPGRSNIAVMPMRMSSDVPYGKLQTLMSSRTHMEQRGEWVALGNRAARGFRNFHTR